MGAQRAEKETERERERERERDGEAEGDNKWTKKEMEEIESKERCGYGQKRGCRKSERREGQ